MIQNGASFNFLQKIILPCVCINNKIQVKDYQSIAKYNEPAGIHHQYFSTKDCLVQFQGSNYKDIDVNTWKRKQIYEKFSTYQNPFWSITSRCDISQLLKVAKSNKIPPSLAILYMIGKTINDIPEFKQRIKNGKPIEFDKVSLSMVIAKEDSTFNICDIDYYDNPSEFLKHASIATNTAKTREELFPEEFREDVVYLSCLPWIDFTSLNNPIGDYKTDSTPRIVWGKFTTEANKTTMPVSVEAHHAFLDGYHGGLFYKKLQENFDNADKIFQSL